MRVFRLATAAAGIGQPVELFVEGEGLGRSEADRIEQGFVEMWRQVGLKRIDAALAYAQAKTLHIVDAVFLQALSECKTARAATDDSDINKGMLIISPGQ